MRSWWRLFANREVRFNWAASIGFALFCVLVATAVRLVLGWLLGTNLPFVFFFPAVLFAALFGGARSGLIAIALAILVTWFAFTPPYFELTQPTAIEFSNFAVFAVASLLVVWLAEAHRRQLARAQDTLHQRDTAKAQLNRTTALFEAVINMTPDLVFVKDLQSRALLRNPAALFGKTWDEVEGRKEAEWHQNPEEAAQVVANDRKVIEAGTSMQFEEQFTTLQGVRTLLSTKSPLFDEYGKVVGIIGVSTDITERENRARHVEFIMRELSHRSKNLLMIIHSIARQSIRQSSSIDDFEEKFTDRLASLARLHDLLIQEEWHGASLRAIAQAQLAPFPATRIELDGPEILLKPNVAQTISMAFHELATNAAKHGALLNAGGNVRLTWGVVSDPRKKIFIRWQEAGGPAVSPPQRSGFGTVVLERIARQIPEASVALQFLPGGVVWQLDAPWDSLVETEDSPSFKMPEDEIFPAA